MKSGSNGYPSYWSVPTFKDVPYAANHTSVVDPKLFFSGSGSYLDLNLGSGSGFGSGLFMKNTLEIQMI
jgi:hypothetical protein